MMKIVIPRLLISTAITLMATCFSVQAQTTLVSTGAVWRYLDNGSDQGTAWRAPAFVDSGWASGPAQFGYGDPDIVTTNSFGPDANNKYITTYYRHTFNVANPASVTNLLLRLIRDDGAVVYLNNTEILRDNLPGGAIAFDTTALAAIADADENTFVITNPAPGLLVSGDNVLAVEIHQSGVTSTDLSFDLELVSNFTPTPPTVAITSPLNGAVIAAVSVNLLATASDPDGTVTKVEFFSASTKIGEDTTAPYSLVASGLTPGTYTFSARATDSTGLSTDSSTVVVQVETPASALIPVGSTWKYHNLGQDLGTTWRDSSFNDASWLAGPGPLGENNQPIATTIGTGPAGARFPTIYFRKSFNVANPGSLAALRARIQRDDGAVVYINGVEAFRNGMADPPAAIGYNTLATFTAEDANESNYYPHDLPTSLLVAGNNVVAVEVHQVNLTSSDLQFDLELIGILPPQVAISTPTNNATFQVPVNFNLEANATDPDGSVARVDFYENITLLGSDTSAPFIISVTNLFEGLHTIVAVATDNGGTMATSAPVNVNVVDLNPPTLVNASGSSNRVTVTFSKRVVDPSATTPGNYTINNGVIVQSAMYGQSSNTIVLTTTPLSASVNYVLTVNNVRDTGNIVIAPNSQIPFQVVGFIAGDVGNPTLAGSTAVVPGGYDVSGAGTDIAGTADQFHFNYESDLRFGDFDIQVRLAGFSGADAWSKAALMARETLAGNSRYAATVATPSISGCYFQYRNTAGGATANSGAAPATFPNLTLRLRRVGSTFTGYVSPDGSTWQSLGSVSIALPSGIYVGLAVSSHSASRLATAQFRDYINATGGAPTLTSAVLAREPLGPSSRKTGLVISEIMYNPRTVPCCTNNSLEFIEIFNGQAYFENISGYRISGAISYTFPPGTVIQAGSFLVLARDPAFLQSHYGISGVLGPWVNATNNGLAGDTGLLRLRGKGGDVLLEVNYEDDSPWPVAADGTGHSLVLARASYGEGDPRAWDASDAVDGSPGRQDPFPSDPMRNVVINEFLAHTDLPQIDMVELYNHGNQAVNLSGAWLSDSPSTNKYRIPNGTILGPRSYISFNLATNLPPGFALSSTGERIFLVNSNQNRVIDAVDFDAQENGVSMGRVPDGAPSFYRLASITAGTNNAAIRMDSIVINEIMYSPISGDDDDEYVELYNRGNTPVNLHNWRFVSGIDYLFPANAILPTNAYLVVAKKPQRMMTNYPGLTVNNTFGPFSGTLANGGERIAVAKPDFEIVTNNNVVSTNMHHAIISEVTYGDGGKWGWWSDGGGSSLELKDPFSDPRQSANWADSDESNKGVWTTIQLTGTLGVGQGTQNDNLQIFLLGLGECLIDEVSVRSGAGPNLVTNPGFETGTFGPDSVGVNVGGWIAQGSHDHSTFENTGFAGARSLHLRAASRGDNGANRVRSPAFSGIAGTVTLSCKAKWVRGWPELLLRLHGGTFEVGGRMEILPNGTPGAPNTRRVNNVGPAIYDVAHSPVLPSATEPVVVTCRASDAQSFSLALKYRVDPAASFNTLAMVDNGTGGDAIARDGVYSATLPGQANGAMVAFYVEGVDSLGTTNLFPQDVFPPAGFTRVFPLDASSRECLVRWGEVQMLGSFATYHLWVNANNVTRWTNRRPLLNNASLDGTFVYNNYRVVYNMTPQYAGSPWHRGQMNSGPAGGQRVDYDIEFPPDDRMFGATDFVWNNPGNPSGGNTSDLSAQSEQTSYQIFKEISVQYNHRRYVHVFVNGNQRSTTGNRSGNFIMEDSQQPNGDIIDQWFPDDNGGTLYKIEDWFEFPDNGDDFTNNDDADLQRRMIMTNGLASLHSGAYRFMWRPRSRGVGESAVDYTPLFGMINLVTPTTDTAPINVQQIEQLVDYEQWMRIFACQHTVGNWDAYGYNRGKNAYTYKPANGKFQQWTWDIDFTMGVGGDGATTGLFGTTDPRITAMWANPAILRAYWRAYWDIIAGPLNSSYMDPIIDAKAAAMAANGINYDPATVSTIKTYVGSRRSYIASQLTSMTNVPMATFGANFVTISSNFMTISGGAPIQVRDIYVNGILYAVNWSNVTNWSVRIALNPGTNTLRIAGVDLRGNTIGSTQTVTGVYTGAAQDPKDYVVINEIMFNPSVERSEFIELFNTSSNYTFDLTGFEFNGLDYTFPGGSLMPPRSFLVLARDIPAFATTYGGTIPVHGAFDGDLQGNGETVSLIKPAVTNAYMTNAVEVVVDRVRYEPVRPWPVGSNDVTTSSSIQLVDSLQDNSRSANWSTLYYPPVFSPATNFAGATNAGWRQVTFTGTVATVGSTFWIWMSSITGGDVYIDDVYLTAGTVPQGGPNLLVNGDFEQSLENGWVAIGNHSTSEISTFARSGNGSLHVMASGPGGTAPTNGIRQFITPPPVNTIHTLSYWFYSTFTATNLVLRTTSGSAFINTTNVNPQVIPPFSNPPMQVAPAVFSYTPGSNNVRTTNLVAFPPLWLNELQASNTVGILDNFGEREPWIELYNAGSTALPLTGYYLANNYDTNLTQWPFPPGSSIGPGEYKVIWADGEPGETAGATLHTSFRLRGNSGSLALVRISNNATQVMDYLSYSGANAALAYGDFPDAQPFYRQTLYSPTPGSANVAQAFPLFINEWMAGNTNRIFDPADGEYDDWFEIYNGGPTDIDIGGFYLTDSLADPTRFRVPATGNYIVPAGGFLLVWADNETNQNTLGNPALHARFQLSLGGEQIAIYAPDGATPIDIVLFNQQTNDISQGRFIDGAQTVFFMTNSTPGLPNTLGNTGNTAPVLAPIANRTNRVGQLISFMASATDAQAPPQTLTFSLLGFPPTGAGVTPGGLFTWTPGQEHAYTTNPITMRVSDDGLPQMSATRTFTIIVLPPPSVTATANGSMVTLTFDAIPGRHYRVEYKNDLNAPEWTPLGPVFQATSPTVMITDNLGVLMTRFYQIVQTD